MKKNIFDHILIAIDQNPSMGISYQEINEKFAISNVDFIELVKSESWRYKLRPTITKDCIFFRKIK